MSKKLPKHRPIQVSPDALDLVHPTDRLRYLALRSSYIDRCKGVSLEKPDPVAIDHALCMSACGLSLHEVLSELGWTLPIFEEMCSKYSEMSDLKNTMELALKAHLDRLLNESIRDQSISLPSLQLRMRYHSPLFNEELINIRDFAKLSLQEKAAKVIDLLSRGDINLRDTNRLLDVLGRVEELSALPNLAKQVLELQEAVRVD